MSSKIIFTKDNMDFFLSELAKAYRKLNKRTAIPLEITLIGGASILVNYEFRSSTGDVDAIIEVPQFIKGAVNKVSDQYDLDSGWLNMDFIRTSSYSRKLIQFSTPYKTFSRYLEVRTIKDEYLIAMKLVAGRLYKHDFTDIIGILIECKKADKPLTQEVIKNAVLDLYGSLDVVKDEVWDRFNEIMENGDYEARYQLYKALELEVKELLIDFNSRNSNNMNESNLNDILSALKDKQKSK